jgi:TM2 domain-containing membrane protein YozV
MYSGALNRLKNFMDMNTPIARTAIQPSSKSYAVAVSISAIFGVAGIHHFYLGRYLEGIVDLGMFIASIYCYLTGHISWAIGLFIIDALHTFIVTIMLLTGSVKDGKGYLVCYPGQKLSYSNN